MTKSYISSIDGRPGQRDARKLPGDCGRGGRQRLGIQAGPLSASSSVNEDIQCDRWDQSGADDDVTRVF